MNTTQITITPMSGNESEIVIQDKITGELQVWAVDTPVAKQIVEQMIKAIDDNQ